jgi:hypothetical protein
MDPEANLVEQLRIAQRILAVADDNREPSPHDALRLAELVAALDDHVSNGGALPDSWRSE